MATLQPVPTYADPVLVDERTGKSGFNPVWLSWFLTLTNGGSLARIVQHNLLQGLQGGGPGEFYHLTAAQHALVVSGGGVGPAGPPGPAVFLEADAADEPMIIPGPRGLTGISSSPAQIIYLESFEHEEPFAIPRPADYTLGISPPALGAKVLTAYTVATLPSASARQDGMAIVTDALTTLVLGLGTAVSGGGANRVGVRSDGTNWIYSF